MKLRRLLAFVSGVLVTLCAASLRAEDALNAFAGAQSDVMEIPTLVEGKQQNTSDATSLLSNSASAGTVDPAGWFLDPGHCSHLDGVGCADCSCDNGCADGDCGCCSCYKVRFVPYGWLFAVHGNATVRGIQRSIDLSMRDTLEIVETDADMFFMGKLEVESNELGMIVNGIYVRLGMGDSIQGFNFASSFDMAIVDIAGTYNLLSDPEYFSVPYVSRFDLLAGIRYWLLDGGLTVTGPLGNTASDSGEKEWVDPIIGGRIITPLCEGVEAQIRGDVGGFGWGTASEFTWNFEALAQMQLCDWMALRAGYRILDVNNHRNSGNRRFGLDTQFRGPVAEVAFQF